MMDMPCIAYRIYTFILYFCLVVSAIWETFILSTWPAYMPMSTVPIVSMKMRSINDAVHNYGRGSARCIAKYIVAETRRHT